MNVLLVINPNAGNSDKKEFAKEAKAYADNQKINLSIYWTKGKNDQENINALLADKQFDRIIAAGGDGTIRTLAIAVKDRKISFGIVPLGTSNGLATDIELPSNPISAFQTAIKSSRKINLDFIGVNKKEYILHIGDLGANANLIKRFENDTKEGYVSYTKHLIDELQELGSFEYTIQTEGNVYRGSAQMIAFCNARKFGSGIPLTSRGNPADGKFEIVIYKTINIATLVKSTLSSLTEDFFTLDQQETIVCKSAQVSLNTKVLLQLDGELIGKNDSIALQIEESQLEVICSSNCPYIN